MENVKIEFDRLCKYMYVPSDSPIASPLVVAPKATFPFHRMCGDYVYINKFMKHIQHFIPIVFNELEKAAKGRVFIDLDMKNAFHQILLDYYTSSMLSILTMWGCVRPLYMPEGISPASGILNSIMTNVLKDALDHTIVIFDNFLVVLRSVYLS